MTSCDCSALARRGRPNRTTQSGVRYTTDSSRAQYREFRYSLLVTVRVLLRHDNNNNNNNNNNMSQHNATRRYEWNGIARTKTATNTTNSLTNYYVTSMSSLSAQLPPGTKQRMLWKQLASCSSSSTSVSSRTVDDNDDDDDDARDETGGSKWKSKSRCEWARHHPQKDAVVRVCHGRDEWKEALREASCNNTDDDELESEFQFSIVSWNTLSDTWYEQGATTTTTTSTSTSTTTAHSGTGGTESKTNIYDHTPRECGVWEGRFPLLLEWISSLRPDVLALQEVDYERFESDLLPELASRFGYGGLIQTQHAKKSNRSKQQKRQQQQQPCGVATFWCRDKLELSDHRVGSRSLATLFRFKRQRRNNRNNDNIDDNACACATVVNVHLESPYPSKGHRRCCKDVDHYYEKARTGQLDSPLKWAASVVAPSSLSSMPMSMSMSVPLVLCGDFNAGAESTLFRALLARERPGATPTTASAQHPPQLQRRSRCWHGHDLCSVYEHPSALAAHALPVATTFLPPHHRCAIDHVLYSHGTATLEAVLDPLTPSERTEQLPGGAAGATSNGDDGNDDDDLEKGFPNAFCPSDHLPIGAVFKLRHQPPAVAAAASTNPVRQSCKDDDKIDQATMETALDSALRKNNFGLLLFDSNDRERGPERDHEHYCDEAPLDLDVDLDAWFANGRRDELIRLLTDRLEVELGCRSGGATPASLSKHAAGGGDNDDDDVADDDDDETLERRRTRVAKCVGKRIGKEYGRWKFGRNQRR